MRAPLSLDRLSHRAVIALVAAGLLLVPFTGTRVLGVLLVAGLLPGLAVASRRFSRDASLGLALALSPVLFALFALAALVAGIQVNGAARIAAGVSLAAFVLLGGHSADSREDAQARRGVLVLLTLAAVMALALPLTEYWWRIREDSWFHAAVADKLARDGLPLTDPYFAGLRLQYMYFYHVLVAACASLAGVDYFHTMILVNGIALASCAFAFHALSGWFSRRTGPRLLGLCVWLFAMNGWFYLFLPLRLVRAMTGETHGLEVLRRFFPWTPAGHDTAVSLIAVEGNQFMFLDKFMIGTAFSLTFSLAASLLYLLVSARRGRWSARHDVAFVLALAGATLFHPVTGITVAVVTALVLAFLLMLRAQPSAGGPSYGRLAAWIALAVAATVPYIRAVSPRDGTGGASIGFAFQPMTALGLFADILPALVFAALYFRRAGSHKDTPDILGARPFAELSLSAAGMLAMWALFAVVIALTVDLTTNNETKFAFPVLLPLAAFSAGAFERVWDGVRARRAAVLAVASATLPLHMLYYHHAVRDTTYLSVSDSQKAVYAWIAKSTPRDAVFIEEQDLVWVPVLASRDLYWGTEGYARNWGYPAGEIAARRSLRDAVFSPEGLSEKDILQLRALGRRVFVIYRMKDDDLINAHERFHEPHRFRGKFATAEIAVWEIVLE